MLSYLPTLLLPSKIPFARYVKQNIFDPLGMTSTTYSYDKAQASGQLADGMARQGINASVSVFSGTARALSYWATSGGEDGNGAHSIVQKMYPDLLLIPNLAAGSGPGGIMSNAVDMVKFVNVENSPSR